MRNWQKGQPTILIDGNTYYTLESATEWEITEAEGNVVTVAAHKGEEWIKKREQLKRKPAIEKVPNRSGEDRDGIKEMLAKNSVRIVSSQEQEVVIVALTPSGHQNARTIKLDQKARRKAEAEKEKTTTTEPNPTGHQAPPATLHHQYRKQSK